MKRLLLLLALAGCTSIGTTTTSSSSGSSADAAVGVPDCTLPLPLDGVAPASLTVVAEDPPSILCNAEPGEYFLVESRDYGGANATPSTRSSAFRERLSLRGDSTFLSKMQDGDGGVFTFGGTWSANGLYLMRFTTCTVEANASETCGYVNGDLLIGTIGGHSVGVYRR